MTTLTGELDASNLVDAVNGVGDTVELVVNKLDQVKDKLVDIKDTLDTMAVSLSLIADQAGAMPTAEQWGALLDNIAAMKSDQDSMVTQLSGINTQVSGVNTDLTAMNTTLGGMPTATNLGSLTTAVGNIHTDLSSNTVGLTKAVNDLKDSVHTDAGKALIVEIGELVTMAVQTFGTNASLYLALFSGVSDLLTTIIAWLTSSEDPPPEALVTADAIRSLRDTIRDMGLSEFTVDSEGEITSSKSWLDRIEEAVLKFVFQEFQVTTHDSKGNRVDFLGFGPPQVR